MGRLVRSIVGQTETEREGERKKEKWQRFDPNFLCHMKKFFFPRGELSRVVGIFCIRIPCRFPLIKGSFEGPLQGFR